MKRRQVLGTLLGVAGGLGAGLANQRQVAAAAEAMSASKTLRALEPFEIDFPQRAIDDLHRRLDDFRWPEMPFDTGWAAGTNDAVLRALVDYWRNDYDWFAVQDALNELTHLRGPIGEDALHCVVYEREGVGQGLGFPLLLLHGWPSTFHEFSAAGPRLASGVDEGPGFDLVVPSLPGYGLSEAPSREGMGPGRIAERLHRLMSELGHDRYGVQGGDWGAIIATQMARRYPDALAGLHLNFATAGTPGRGVNQSREEIAYRDARAVFQRNQTGYSVIQGTRPQTLAYAQNDSPVGWLAWMLEKYWAWSDHGDDLWETFSRDDILTTAMLYWLPGRILSAARLYYESRNAPPESRLGGRVEVPTGYARFPGEPWAPPREVIARGYNLVHYSEPDRGGHFPALEQPALWASDVGRFFRSL